jgi:hypothetical protein
MATDDATELLAGLVFTAQLKQLAIRARFGRSQLIYGRPVSDGRPWPSSPNEIDTSNFFVAPANPKARGEHIALRHAVTKRLAEHSEQFARLEVAELRALEQYFAFDVRTDLWDPVTHERSHPSLLRRALDVLKRVDRVWYLSLFEGRLGFAGTGTRP